MAAAGGRLLAAAASRSVRAGRAGPLVPCRGATVTRSGAILPKPVKVRQRGWGRRGGRWWRSGPVTAAPSRRRSRLSPQTPFGLLRVFSVVIPFLYVGTQISKNFAALLEEHDIFVPEDDDDDD